MSTSEVNTPRVAVIVVHGVADQRAGETANSVVDLLVSSKLSTNVAYEATNCRSFTLNVDPLAPKAPNTRFDVPTPTSETRPLDKALAQSYRSDFHRTDSGIPRAATKAPLADRGLAVTNYLLSKYLDNGAVSEAYNSSCIELTRTAPAGGPDRVDVYEMYWADLSRLSGAIPRIVTELFTMVFRLSKLGRETVVEASRHVQDAHGKQFTSWRWLAALQPALDWGFVNGLALLFAQLGMLALVIVPFGVLAPYQPVLRYVIGGAVLAFGLLWLLYRWRDAQSLKIAPASLVLIAAVMLAFEPSTFWILGLLWLGALSFGLAAALRVADERFPLSRLVGLTLWGLVLVLVVGHVLSTVGFDHGALFTLADWVRAAIYGIEQVLRAIKFWWISAALVFLVWFTCGVLAARHGGYEGSASVGTGRIGVFVSLGTFVMLTMAAWALISTVIDYSVRGLPYKPSIFSEEEMKSGKSDAARAAERAAKRFLPPAKHVVVAEPAAAVTTVETKKRPRSDAQIFLTARYEDSVVFFSLVAAVMLLLVLYLSAMFLPSVLAELKILAQRARRIAQEKHHHADSNDGASSTESEANTVSARRLGRWLTAGYRRLDHAVMFIVSASIVISIAVGLVFLPDTSGVVGRIVPTLVPAHWSDGVAFVSLEALKPLILGAAGLAALLTAFGGILSRYLPSLRAPLDVALDVDNYFREFPRRSIPRARMFSRYAALLEYVSQQGYDRIVIVSHSQGTVISAELLRFLSAAEPGVPDAGHDRAAKLRQLLGTQVRLLTLGCPLRQLYAARFPSLYKWVVAPHKGGNGPKAADIGVDLWANAFTSGDYVGRWLWSSPAVEGDAIGHPMVDTVHPATLGRTDAYSSFNPMPPDSHPLATAQELEVCLGVGAHTHYLEPDQGNVAWLIDHLVAATSSQLKAAGNTV